MTVVRRPAVPDELPPRASSSGCADSGARATTTGRWGANQLILHVKDGKPASASAGSDGSDATLHAIAGKSDSDIWAVGEKGLIVHYDGTA